jgi:uncharacterized protein YraI
VSSDREEKLVTDNKYFLLPLTPHCSPFTCNILCKYDIFDLVSIVLKRKLLKSFLYLSLAFVSLNTSLIVSAEQITMDATVTADILVVRQDPKAEGTIVTSLKKGSKIRIIGSDDSREWFQVLVQNKKGWVSQKSVQVNYNGSVNYNTVSTIGTANPQGILNNALKIAVSGDNKYVLDSSEKYWLNIYDKNNNFVSRRELNYPWVTNRADENYIVIAVDEEKNLYTNATDRNTITRFDQSGQKNGEIKADLLGDVSFIIYDSLEKILYSLDNSQKTIKGFDKKGAVVKNIFLSETNSPKSFALNNGKVYVLDYPESINPQLYYVNSYSFALRNNYDVKAPVVENLSRGSILKFNPEAKTYKSKALIDDDPSKAKEISWIDFSEKGKNMYGVAEELKKVTAQGEIDIYKTSGEPVDTVLFNKKWTLTSPDRHKVFNDSDIFRKMIGVNVDNDGTIIVPVLSKIKNTGTASLNYYYFNINEDSYKVSQPLPFNDISQIPSAFSAKNIFTTNSRGYLTVINENGIEKENIGRVNPSKFNVPEKISLNNNKLYVFDRGNFTFGEYDLNGEPLKSRRIDQGSDLFNWADVFYRDNTVMMAKTLDAEEKKLGIEIYNLNFKKIFDKWLMSIEANTLPKVAYTDKNEIFVAGKGSFYGKKSFLTMFNDKGHLINFWKDESDLIRLFPEAIHRNIKNNSLRLVGFDQDANIYIFNALTLATNQSRISKVSINTEGKGEIIKNFDSRFFNDTNINDLTREKLETLPFSNTIDGEVLDIKTGKNGFTYFLYKDKNTKIARLGLFDPTGNFWKEFSFNNFGSVHGFNLDNQDNIWITEDSGIKKLATYK